VPCDAFRRDRSTSENRFVYGYFARS
jgi:hypothetical protein